MNKSPIEKFTQHKLKTHTKESHNQGCSDEHIIALVKFLARCAAEDDYRATQELLATPEKFKGGN